MRFSVRVPVLSTHSTETAPSVSIAARRRVSTCRCASRHAPMAGNTVITTGSSSGSSDIASAIPASRACSQWPSVTPSSSTSTVLRAAASMAKRRASNAAWRRKGESARSSVRKDMPMTPIWLRAPVAATRAMA